MATLSAPAPARLALVLGTRLHGRAAFVPLAVRLAAGAVFLAFSVGKFARHGAEAAALDRYGIPYPDQLTSLVGLLEAGGGLLLVSGRLTRPAALALAGNMAVAIVTAGRVEGGPVHLGLAPALLAAMLFLLWAGPGRASLDARLLRRLSGPAA